ncbi:hypothetical protein BDV96DRAFT_158096 [Lophiotrema nucula]|uniref:Uncharacterized protein n=1 Tax=Lophiotrema nucula TaxID=690887 RepID=A0A6A5YYK1_9PLEO|nr:hypothetical protein BDV96DRAFT_158096 [Lophiotrema nucula]
MKQLTSSSWLRRSQPASEMHIKSGHLIKSISLISFSMHFHLIFRLLYLRLYFPAATIYNHLASWVNSYMRQFVSFPPFLLSIYYLLSTSHIEQTLTCSHLVLERYCLQRARNERPANHASVSTITTRHHARRTLMQYRPTPDQLTLINNITSISAFLYQRLVYMSAINVI